MSGGRGSNNNRSRGRGGSGRGYNRRNQNRSNDKKSGGSNSSNGASERKKVFEPYYAGKHQADTYDSVKEQLILHIQKTFSDSSRIVRTLREENSGAGKPTEPTLDTVAYTDGILNKPAEKMKLDLEQQGYNIAYKEKLRLYNEGERQHEENMVKAFATIMNNYCSKVMKHRVEEKPDYESAV